MTVLVERPSRLVVERNLPRSTSLRRTKLPAVDSTAHDDPARLQSNIGPLEGPQLAAAYTRVERNDDHRPVSRARSGNELISFLEGEEVLLRLGINALDVP